MVQTTHDSRHILPHARWQVIHASLLMALLLHYLPIGRWPVMPDWVALVLAIWGVREPRRLDMRTGFIYGLLTDIGFGAVLGQHALGYVLVVYGAQTLSRRILWFSPWAQALHILPLLLLSQLAMLLLRLGAGDSFPGWPMFLGAFTATALWAPLQWLLMLPQVLAAERDDRGSL